jgi:hypothetical protein
MHHCLSNLSAGKTAMQIPPASVGLLSLAIKQDTQNRIIFIYILQIETKYERFPLVSIEVADNKIRMLNT